jgi:hypothetical protein
LRFDLTKFIPPAGADVTGHRRDLLIVQHLAKARYDASSK